MPNLISVGQLIDHSWEYYRHRFLELMRVSGWLLLPALVGIISLAFYPAASTIDAGKTLTTTEHIGIFIWAFDTFIFAPLVGVWIFIGLGRQITARLEHPEITSLPVMRHLPYLWPTILVNILLSLLLAASLVFTLPGIAVYSLGVVTSIHALGITGSVLFFIGMIISLIVGFRWFVEYAFAQYTVLVEEKRGKSALIRSRELIEPHFWRAFIRMILPKIVFLLCALIIESALNSLVGLVITGTAGLNLDLQFRLGGIASTLIFTATALIINPLMITADILLYHSLREAKPPSTKNQPLPKEMTSSAL